MPESALGFSAHSSSLKLLKQKTGGDSPPNSWIRLPHCQTHLCLLLPRKGLEEETRETNLPSLPVPPFAQHWHLETPWLGLTGVAAPGLSSFMLVPGATQSQENLEEKM